MVCPCADVCSHVLGGTCVEVQSWHLTISLDCVPLHWSRQGPSLNPEIPSSGQSWGLLSLSPETHTATMPGQLFMHILRIQSLVLTLGWRGLYPLSHLPGSSISIESNKTLGPRRIWQELMFLGLCLEELVWGLGIPQGFSDFSRGRSNSGLQRWIHRG